MTTIHKSALVPYRPMQMFALVDDINTYPEFLPWCRSAQELMRDDDEVRARLEIAYSGVHKSFTTLNRMQRGKMIDMRLVEGPFQRLEGFWRFDALGEEGARITFDLEFEFSSRFLSLTLGPVFSQIANTLVAAFTQRAVNVYG